MTEFPSAFDFRKQFIQKYNPDNLKNIGRSVLWATGNTSNPSNYPDDINIPQKWNFKKIMNYVKNNYQYEKDYIANGKYPVDLDKISDMLMDAYRDLKS